MPGKTNSLRDKLEDNQLDLSLSQLTEVPVQEISELPKGTHLDLSNNHLTWLPENFPTLSHLIQLDLSKNQLSELPEYFGQLRNLRHLDLYSNQLRTLPITFGQLKSLKWLDLKNNPLEEGLAKSAGPCITPSDCANCAKSVVLLMQNIQSKQERDRQKVLLEQRKLDEQRRLEEEKEREKARVLKKAAKERKRAEARLREEQSRQAAESAAMASIQHEMQQNNATSNGKVGGNGSKDKSYSCFWSFWMFMVTVLLIALGFGTSLLWIYTGGQLDQHSVEKALPLIQRDFGIQWNKLSLTLMPYVKGMKANSLWLWEEFKRRNDYVAHYINTNWGPAWCSAQKTMIEYWNYVLRQGQALSERARPYFKKSVEWANRNFQVYWKWLEQNIPIYMDHAYEQCHQWYIKMDSSYRQWMKT